LAYRDDLAEEALDRNHLLLRPRLPRLEHQLPPRPALRDLAGDRFLGPKDRAPGLDVAADAPGAKCRHQRGGPKSPTRFPLGSVTVATAPKSCRRMGSTTRAPPASSSARVFSRSPTRSETSTPGCPRVRSWSARVPLLPTANSAQPRSTCSVLRPSTSR